ncbi:MAG TPA: hypothetical protein VF770_08150 [Solirubrobacterales bacterium]
MHRIRKRLTYANVMSSIAVFLVLGGAAFAAMKLPRNSVGTSQLKNSAVTTAKIRKGAVDGRKIADGSITGADINTPRTTFGRVVAKLRSSGTLGLTEELQVYPLNPSTYTQASEEDDAYVGAVDVTFPSSCNAPRSAVARVSLDASNPTKEEETIVGYGRVSDSGTEAVSKRIEISPFFFEKGLTVTGYRFEPGTAKSHTVSLVVKGECEGGGSGITATFGGVDVIGTK